MAEPKKKLSKTRTNLRRSRYVATAAVANVCSNCQAPVLPHHVCAKCGFYNGQSVRAQAPTKRILADSDTTTDQQK